ncbi:hypothetical protein DVH24_016922 [Malus domestica]|uniref:Uncharacterized protein n=1 Tax=Malus domestica TaxID=3750 RepID=A0A498IRM9_MALDO|nr:hypothetical protein DVH24_016922 [Malus domestica]
MEARKSELQLSQLQEPCQEIRGGCSLNLELGFIVIVYILLYPDVVIFLASKPFFKCKISRIKVKARDVMNVIEGLHNFSHLHITYTKTKNNLFHYQAQRCRG